MEGISVTKVMTLSEVTELLQCSKAHISKLVNGQIPGVPRLPVIQIGRRKLVRREALEVWLREAEGVAGDASSGEAAEATATKQSNSQRRKIRKVAQGAQGPGCPESGVSNLLPIESTVQVLQELPPPSQETASITARQVITSLLQKGVLRRASDMIRPTQPRGTGEC